MAWYDNFSYYNEDDSDQLVGAYRQFVGGADNDKKDDIYYVSPKIVRSLNNCEECVYVNNVRVPHNIDLFKYRSVLRSYKFRKEDDNDLSVYDDEICLFISINSYIKLNDLNDLESEFLMKLADLIK